MENSQCCPKCFMNGTDYDQLEDLVDLYQVEQITPRSFKDARIKKPHPLHASIGKNGENGT